MKYRIVVFLIPFVLLTLNAAELRSQTRDFMTDAEIELVRENQEVDLRIDVLIRMIDRRFAALGIVTEGPKSQKKVPENWGPEPTGTRFQLLTDVNRLIEKAISDVDSVAGRQPEKMVAPKKGESVFNKAVKALVNAANRWQPLLKKENAAAQTAQDEKLYGITGASVEFCDQIIEAMAKLK